MTSFIRNLVKEIGDKDTTLLADALNSAEVTGFIDTGSYMFNGLLSTSLYGGLPNNRVTCLAGDQATGKTYFALDILQNYLAANETNFVKYDDTESAGSKETFLNHGCDPERIIIGEPATVEQYKTQAAQFLDLYMKKEDRPNCMMILDSLGMLSSEKEVKDTVEGNNVSDMTRAKAIRAAFRVLTLKLAKARVPLLMTNHTYDSLSQYTAKQIAGGGGVKYAASTIVMLGKKKDKDTNNDVIGNIITATLAKSRLSKEFETCELKLSYKTGLDRYYGLLDLAEEAKIIPVKAGRYEMPDGSKHFAKAIYGDPTRFFTPDIMARLETAAKEKFRYGSSSEETDDDL